jgi:hypothetical protein
VYDASSSWVSVAENAQARDLPCRHFSYTGGGVCQEQRIFLFSITSGTVGDTFSHKWCIVFSVKNSRGKARRRWEDNINITV